MSVEVKTPTRSQFEHGEFPCGEKIAVKTEVKTPTRSQFEHSEFPCGEKLTVKTEANNSSETLAPKPLFNKQESQALCLKRRRSSYHSQKNTGNLSHSQKKRRYSTKPNDNRDVIRLPTTFLLGGNISDPLNLNSLCDEEVSRLLNQKTPYSSPIPTPAHKKEPVEVIIPPNITDPLNLNNDEDNFPLVSPVGSSKKRKKNKHKKSRDDESVRVDDAITTNTKPKDDFPKRPTCLNSNKPVKDKIVSPVVPQISPRSRRGSKRNAKPDPSGEVSKCLIHDKKFTDTSKHRNHDNKQQHTSSRSGGGKKFTFGNYNRYYGYRNPDSENDVRFKGMKEEWFIGKDVLDIGCNIGHVTCTVARDFKARKVVGIDIDGKLIKIARQNIRHYLSTTAASTTKFPTSMSIQYGPIAAPAVLEDTPQFPNNILFLQGNYVLESDELLELQKEEYDVILGLSLTKWIHLNFKDEGIKRTFKRMHRQLRPGGKLILEPQGFASYKRKKKITDEIHKNFQSILFKPEQFTEYLLSREVGFSTCEKLDIPFNKSKGFHRPLLLFTKAEPPSCVTTPATRVHSEGTPGSDVFSNTPDYSGTDTPTYSSYPNTPKFYFSSASNTPTHDEGAPSVDSVPNTVTITHMDTIDEDK